MNLGFYFDPSSPYCWITSRWLVATLKQREIYVQWRPFSLAMHLGENLEQLTDNEHTLDRRAGHRILRLIEAAGLAGHDRGEVYTSFGYEHFVAKRPYDDDLIQEVLKQHRLMDIIDAANSTALDADIFSSVREANELLGHKNVNVPICAFEVGNKHIGYFGPILNSVPTDQEAVRIWDGVVSLATTPEFNQLVRPVLAAPDTAQLGGR
ncbi:MAG: disulfide bond formation protein DsbA [Acidobacteriota bacterium]